MFGGSLDHTVDRLFGSPFWSGIAQFIITLAFAGLGAWVVDSQGWESRLPQGVYLWAAGAGVAVFYWIFTLWCVEIVNGHAQGDLASAHYALICWNSFRWFVLILSLALDLTLAVYLSLSLELVAVCLTLASVTLG